jgi:DNA-binding beta-propeller fold protein YncE
MLFAAIAPAMLIVPPFEHTLGFNRIGRYFINLYLGRSFRVSDPQGICGAKMVEEDEPGLRDDHILTMFSVNSGTGQVVYNVKLVEPKVFGSAGSGPGQFGRPHGICCNPQGDVYVADTDNDRVVRLKYEKGELRWVGVADSGLSSPRDVALDSRGRVFVADSGNDRIVVIDGSGVRQQAWAPGLEGPTGLAVIDDGATYNEFGTNSLVVIDRGRTRVNRLSLAGEILAQVDMRRIGIDEAGFAYCAFDRFGNSYVTDQVNCQVHIFDPALKYIATYGREGTGDARFDSPRGIAIWPRFGQVFIAEQEGGQYYWLGLDAYLIGFYPPEFDSREPGTTIALYVTGLAEVTVAVTDSSGAAVRTLTPPHYQKPGEALIVWDGRDDSGALVPPGEYGIAVTASPTYNRQPKYRSRKELAGKVRRLPDPPSQEQ